MLRDIKDNSNIFFKDLLMGNIYLFSTSIDYFLSFFQPEIRTIQQAVILLHARDEMNPVLCNNIKDYILYSK
jgi:hypothetical protein